MTPVLQLGDVTFRRDGKQIIGGVSLTVNPGEHWALLGPKGAGKSTLLGYDEGRWTARAKVSRLAMRTTSG